MRSELFTLYHLRALSKSTAVLPPRGASLRGMGTCILIVASLIDGHVAPLLCKCNIPRIGFDQSHILKLPLYFVNRPRSTLLRLVLRYGSHIAHTKFSAWKSAVIPRLLFDPFGMDRLLDFSTDFAISCGSVLIDIGKGLVFLLYFRRVRATQRKQGFRRALGGCGHSRDYRPVGI